MVVVDGLTPIAAIITSFTAVAAGCAIASVPLVVAKDEAARKFTVPTSVAAVAERNVGIAETANEVAGLKVGVAKISTSPTENSAAALRLDDRRPTTSLGSTE